MARIQLALFLCSATVLARPFSAKAEQRPPVGQRSYHLEKKEPYAPVEIKAANASKGEDTDLMRDPIPFTGKLGGLKELARPTRPAPAKKNSRMVFEQVAVHGRYLVPRVSFDRPSLPLERAEEPVQVDYRGKIKESESILREFDW